MAARRISGLLMILGLALAGCSSKNAQHVATYEHGAKFEEKKVNDAGLYTLHAPGHEEVTYNVVKGERVGFRHGMGGTIVAYAGDNPPVELDRGTANGAYWKLETKAKK